MQKHYWAGNSTFMVSVGITARNKKEAAKIFRDQYGFEANYIYDDTDPDDGPPTKKVAASKKAG